MKRIESKRRLFGKSVIALSVAASASAMAQTESVVLEEVVVTAEFREATLQDTQISISAFNEEAIDDRGISNALDLAQFAPNVNAQAYVGGKTGVSFNIRGIGNAETLISFDPAVSVYLDGVLISKNVGALLDVLELERIEILRGPQGTLYGRNTMGGAVNYITRKPVNEFEASLKANLGDYNQQDYRGSINVPLLGSDGGSELNLRLSAGSLNRDGYQDNVFANAVQKELGTKDREVYMGQLQWRPTDSFSVLYTYDATRIDEVPEAPWVTNANPATATGRNLAPFDQSEDDRPETIQINGIGIADTEVDGQALDIRWQLADSMTLQSLSGYREMSNNSVADSDGSPLTVLSTRDIQSNEAFSQEFRLFGTTGRLDYSAGLFYMDEEGDVYQEQIVFGGSSGAIAEYKNEAVAAYGQGTFAITDQLDLTVGLRYTEEEREMGKASYAGRTFNPAPTLDEIRAAAPVAGTTLFPLASNDFDNASWLVSLGYNWTDDVLTYAKVSTGFQSGGFNARDASPVDFVNGFKEETLLAYELGLKSRWANRFQVNAAAFFSDYDDKRVNQFNQQTLASVQRNAGVVEIWGVEFEVLAQLTDNLQAGLNYGHVDHEYVEYLNTQNGVTTDLSDVSNFPYSPENTASAFIAYDFPLNFGLLRARLDYSYRDEMTFLVPQPERNSSEGAEILNARVTLQEIKGPGDSTMRVSLWGKNLTDESYWNFGVNIFSSFGFDINTYGEPRTYGLELEIDF